MATVTTGNIPRLLQEGIEEIFGDTYDAHPIQYDKIFDTKTSSKAFSLNVQVEGFGLAREKDENTGAAFDDFAQGFTPKYVNKTFALGFIMTEEAIDDQLYDQGTSKAEALAFSISTTKEIEGANVLNRATTGTGLGLMPGGDGQPLLSTVHVNGPSGGTYSNKLAVDADFEEASLEDLLIIIGNTTNPRQLQIALIAMKLIVSVANQFEAQRVLNSVLQSNTANNDTNAVRDMNSVRDGFTVNNYKTDDDAWFLKTNAPKGMTYYTRRARRIRRDNAFTTGNARFISDERWAFGWSDPRGIAGSTGG